MIEELRDQLIAERRHHESEIAALLKELGEARIELAQRRLAEVFAVMPSPSEMRH